MYAPLQYTPPFRVTLSYVSCHTPMFDLVSPFQVVHVSGVLGVVYRSLGRHVCLSYKLFLQTLLQCSDGSDSP